MCFILSSCISKLSPRFRATVYEFWHDFACFPRSQDLWQEKRQLDEVGVYVSIEEYFEEMQNFAVKWDFNTALEPEPYQGNSALLIYEDLRLKEFTHVEPCSWWPSSVWWLFDITSGWNFLCLPLSCPAQGHVKCYLILKSSRTVPPATDQRLQIRHDDGHKSEQDYVQDLSRIEEYYKQWLHPEGGHRVCL